MRRTSRLVALSAAALLAGGLAACTSSSAAEEEASSGEFQPITIEHALGTTTIESRPERVATVQWANHEVP
ncbi:iron-siderophore ABC transporter substrate-binding protein, partial [Blastococcus sp. CT_GayMR20]